MIGTTVMLKLFSIIESLYLHWMVKLLAVQLTNLISSDLRPNMKGNYNKFAQKESLSCLYHL